MSSLTSRVYPETTLATKGQKVAIDNEANSSGLASAIHCGRYPKTYRDLWYILLYQVKPESFVHNTMAAS